MAHTDHRSAARPSVLARLGLGYLPPDQPVSGRGARIRWWQRARAIVVLGLLVVILGAAVAAGVGAIVFLSGFLLEQAVN